MENIQEKTEEKIIDWAIGGAGNRLVIFKPEDPTISANLVVEKKGDYDSPQNKDSAMKTIVKAQIFGISSKKKVKRALISVNSQVKMAGNDIFSKDIDIKKFGSNKDFYFIFTFFDVLRQDIDDYFCFISLDDLRKIAKSAPDKNIFRFESSLSPGKKDKYSKFLINKKDLSKILFNIASKA